MQRRTPNQCMRGPLLKLSVKLIQLAADSAHRANSVTTLVRKAAMRGSTFSGYFDPGKALVRNRDCQAGGLGHDSGIRFPTFHQRFSTDAYVFLVDDGGEQEAAFLPSSVAGDEARCFKHRRQTTLHISRAAPETLAVAFNGIKRAFHAVDADSIRMTAEHQRRTWLGSFQHANDVVAARRNFLDGHI